MRLSPLPSVISLFLIAMSHIAFAEQGDPDPRFGENGRVVVSHQWNQMHADSTARQTVQGRHGLYVLGTRYDGGMLVHIITRLRADGTPDESFGPTGTVDFDVLFGFYEAFSFAQMTMDSMGRLVVVGTATTNQNRNFLVCRVNADGSLDNSFGGMGFGCGTAAIDLIANGIDTASNLVIQPNGRIVVVGKAQFGANAYRMTAARFTAGGMKDLSFGMVPGSGHSDIIFPQWQDCEGKGAALDSLGRVVMGGDCRSNPNVAGDVDFALARLLSDGKIDNSFNFSGRTTISFDLGPQIVDQYFWADVFTGMALRPDDSIVIVGNAQTADVNGSIVDNHLALAKLDASGQPDESFAPDGKKHRYLCDVCQHTTFTGMKPLRDGRVYVSGHTDPGTGNTDFVVMRLGLDGNNDQSFAGGMVYAGFDQPNNESYDESGALSLHNDSPLVSGFRILSSQQPDNDAAIIRFQGDTIFRDGLDWIQ